MRAALRLLAKANPAKYLEPYAPTGLAGLATHPSPRPTLIHLYNTTLSQLKTFPESSVYRKSTEAITKERLEIIESTKPPGYEEWLQRVKAVIAEDPERFKGAKLPDGSYIVQQKDDLYPRAEWDGEAWDPKSEGAQRNEEDMAALIKDIEADYAKAEQPDLSWETEPAWEATQVAEVENKIGAGLIEEVIQVAQGELKLIHELAKSKVWEELAEKPRPGQWEYFERHGDQGPKP